MGTTVPAILQRHGIPDIVVAVFGGGRMDARVRGQEPVIAEATTHLELYQKLGALYPDGFAVEFRDDPHM